MRRLIPARPAVLVLGLAASLTTLAGCKPDVKASGPGGETASSGRPSIAGRGASSANASDDTLDYTPPALATLKDDELGRAARRGLALMTHTHDSLPAYAPGSISCTNCHLEGGTKRGAAGLMGVYARFPKLMDRTGAVIPLEDRVNYCFTRSLAGRRIPADSREMRDIVAYLSFISRGVPTGAHVRGEGMPKMPALTGDSARGHRIFASTCAVCHGPEGRGSPPAFPALWGPGSYAVGASMAREERAASFIRHFMPFSKPGSLTDQEAFDVAAYVNAMPRPDSPGKEGDWPAGGAPKDVPYDTKGHTAYRPPAHLFPRMGQGLTVPAPVSVVERSGRE
jgi:thiosulfate dehydrogenase